MGFGDEYAALLWGQIFVAVAKVGPNGWIGDCTTARNAFEYSILGQELVDKKTRTSWLGCSLFGRKLLLSRLL